jgi:hypothetical protein
VATTLSSVGVERRLLVARHARKALAAAGGIGKVPTPLDDVAAALEVLSTEDLFALDPDAPPGLIARMMRLAGKLKGAMAIRERTVYLDPTQDIPQGRFTLGHELGHKALPWHDDAYYVDNDRHLRPDTRDELEAEANAFSAELIFNLNEFTDRAHASRLGLAAPLELTDLFQVSRRAVIRRYVEDAPRPCALVVLGQFVEVVNGKRCLRLLNGIESSTFADKYGPVIDCLPTYLPIDTDPIAHDAWTALRGQASEPVTAGQLAAVPTKRGSVRMNYEIYSNTYAAFLLLYPHRMLVIGPRLRVQWSTSKDDRG